MAGELVVDSHFPLFWLPSLFRSTAFLSEKFPAAKRERSVEDQLDFSPNEIV